MPKTKKTGVDAAGKAVAIASNVVADNNELIIHTEAEKQAFHAEADRASALARDETVTGVVADLTALGAMTYAIFNLSLAGGLNDVDVVIKGETENHSVDLSSLPSIETSYSQKDGEDRKTLFSKVIYAALGFDADHAHKSELTAKVRKVMAVVSWLLTRYWAVEGQKNGEFYRMPVADRKPTVSICWDGSSGYKAGTLFVRADAYHAALAVTGENPNKVITDQFTKDVQAMRAKIIGTDTVKGKKVPGPVSRLYLNQVTIEPGTRTESRVDGTFNTLNAVARLNCGMMGWREKSESKSDLTKAGIKPLMIATSGKLAGKTELRNEDKEELSALLDASAGINNGDLLISAALSHLTTIGANQSLINAMNSTTRELIEELRDACDGALNVDADETLMLGSSAAA